MIVKDMTELRKLYDLPNERVIKKCMPKLDKHSRLFISLSPFLVISSFAGGKADASPRGDRPGFVGILDDQTLVLPDRPGNNRLDTMANVLENPAIGMIFFIPGINETLRVNGRAEITTDPSLLNESAINRRLPASAMKITVEEVYIHCAKALMRSGLWKPETFIERSRLPSAGQIQAEQIGLKDVAAVEREIEHHNKTMLY